MNPVFSTSGVKVGAGYTADLHRIPAPRPSPKRLVKVTSVKPPPKEHTGSIIALTITLSLLVGFIGYSALNVRYATEDEELVDNLIRLQVPLKDRVDHYFVGQHHILLTFEPVSFPWNDPMAGFLFNATNWSGVEFDVRLFAREILCNTTYRGQDPVVFTSRTETADWGRWGGPQTEYYDLSILMNDWRLGEWYPPDGLTLILNDTLLTCENFELWVLYSATVIPEFGLFVVVMFLAVVIPTARLRPR